LESAALMTDLHSCMRADGAVFETEHSADTPTHFGDPLSEYAALTAGCGVADFSHRTQVELRGADRASFLHNLCTNDIRKLAPGTGCEAFLTDAQGHTLFFANVFVGAEALVVETVPGQGPGLLAHLDKYLIREKVELVDLTNDWAELLVAGAGAAAVLERLDQQLPALKPKEMKLLDHFDAAIVEIPARVRRVDCVLPAAWLISCERQRVGELWRALRAAGALPCGARAVEMARIEAGTPLFGPDIGDRNLPQELARNDRAISFVKGCYLGQETVARIDALGHVNKTLAGVRFDGAEVPTAGTPLSKDGSEVGKVASAAWSPRLAAPLALAYVRRGSEGIGTRLESPVGNAVVVKLPLD
jgi:folate-binding protein YgfZ